MGEYWWSASVASARLMSQSAPSGEGGLQVPAMFRRLRPWIHHGWEMVLIAALLRDPAKPLLEQDLEDFVADYQARCETELRRRGWSAPQLQAVLEAVRREAVQRDRAAWLARHRPFPGVPERLSRLQSEGADWAVLTTKGRDFTAEILDGLELIPSLLFGHEAGPKTDVLRRLGAEHCLAGFVEDRRPTLEAVRVTPGLEALRCYLASWGYLRPGDHRGLPQGIALLDDARFASPLADWP